MKNYFPILLIALGLGACGRKKGPSVTAHADTKTAKVAPRSDTVYTCSMHPQVMLDHPGKCPICGMELIPVKKGTGQQEGTVILSDQQIQLGGIHLDTVGASTLGDRMLLTGTAAVDETRSTAVTARIDGRIERLYFKAIGEYLHKGDKLYDLYSEQLNNAKQEYLLALDRMETLKGGLVDLKPLAEAARNKLLLWGMSDGQVAELAQTRQVGRTTSFYSPSDGYIMSVDSHEGDYVAPGTVLVRLADLSDVWVETQVYSSQLSALKRAGKVTVRFPDLPEKEFSGKISLVNPELDPDQRTNLVRVTLANRGGALKPGMPAEVTVISGSRRSLSLPETAVLWSKGGYLVWIAAGQRNAFRPVMVGTGLEEQGRIEILSGLHLGDIVVTQGAYLLNSEYSFRHGQDAMAGMKM